MSKAPQLTGQALADALAITYRHYADPKHDGKVWATDCGGGWVELRGEGLKVNPGHPQLSLFTNGWSMLSRLRYNEARARIREAARAN